MKRIIADVRKCLACRGCEIACAVSHAEGETVEVLLSGRARPSIYLVSAGGLAVPLQCRHCEDAPCIRVCPTGALSREDPGAPVLADSGKCIGCQFCVQACPFGVIRVAGGRAIIKCDLCQARRVEGLEPACVAACPVGALALAEVDDEAKGARAKAAAKAASAVRDMEP